MAHDPARTSNLIREGKIDSEFLRNKLKLKSSEARQSLYKKYPHVEKFFADKGLDLGKIREHSAKIIKICPILRGHSPGLPSRRHYWFH